MKGENLSAPPLVKLVAILSDSSKLCLINLFNNSTVDLEVILLSNSPHNCIQQVNVPISVVNPDDSGCIGNIKHHLSCAHAVVQIGSNVLKYHYISNSLRKLNIPYISIVLDSLVEFTDNDWLVFSDNLENSAKVLLSHEVALQLKKDIGTSGKYAINFESLIEGLAYGFNINLRNKFRKYLKVAEEDVLIMLTVREEWYVWKLIIQCIVRYQAQNKQSKLKLLVCSADIPDSIKYNVLDSGLKSSVLFLSQNITDFQIDLYCAVDVLVDAENLFYGMYSSGLILPRACGLRVLSSFFRDQELLSNPQLALNKFYSVFSRAVSKVTEVARQNSEASPLLIKNLIDQVIKEKLSMSPIERQTLTELGESLERYIRLNDQESSLGIIKDLDERVDTFSPRELSYVLRLKADLELKRGNLNRAMELYDSSVSSYQKNWQSYLGLAKVALMSKAHEEALMFFRKVLVLQPSNAEAFSGVGQVHRIVGMVEESIYWFHKAVLMNSHEENKYILELCQAALLCEEVEKPIQVLESLDDKSLNGSPVVMALGQLYLKAGEFEKGQAMVAKALSFRTQ